MRSLASLLNLKKLLGPVLSVVLFAAAGWLLHNELKTFHFSQIIGYLEGIPLDGLLAAAGLTLLSYLVLTCYDVLALRYVRQPLPYSKTGLASFIGYAFSNNIGLSMIAGASIRYRLYSAWGLGAFEITKVVMFCSLTVWLGFLGLGGIMFVVEEQALPPTLPIPLDSLPTLGGIMLAMVMGYFVLSIFYRKTITFKKMSFGIPAPPMAAVQIGLAVLDWILAGGVLFILLSPFLPLSFFAFLQIFLLAQFLGLVSQIPGGLGVFETIMVTLMAPKIPAAQIFAVLVVYRVLYYWLPLASATLLLGIQEAVRLKTASRKLLQIFGQWVSPILPQILGVAAMVAGTILMFSSATPDLQGRLEILETFLPLPLLEMSHFVGSLAGMGLIILGRGLQRRLDAAWVLAIVLLSVGILTSLLKGVDYEEATLLAMIEAGLLPSRRHFYRKSSLFNEPFNAGWIAAILIVVGASIWLGFLAHRHVEYSNSLWWQFTFSNSASRFLRGTVGAVTLLLCFSLIKLLRPSPLKQHRWLTRDTAKVASLVRQSPDTNANLALLGDKQFLLSDNEEAFIMFGTTPRCWVSMGDPIGPVAEWPELIWRFRELADTYGAAAVFYEVGHEHLYLYLDLGLSMVKLGETARIELADFSLAGKRRKSLRYTLRKLEKEGCLFTFLPVERVGEHLKELEEISNAWLGGKNTREKSFSLGSFSREYLSSFPVFTVQVEGRIVAFANVWLGADRQEASIDLMRFRPDAPKGVMEYLFINAILWAQQEGYQWFNLGEAPLSGLENRALAPLWTRLGAFIYRHGENFYNFKGLREYKEKFEPVWQPKYLASPSGISLPQVFASLASLISGGIKGVLSK